MMYLNWKKVLSRIKHALDNQLPFSMVRIGDGENIVMAQKSVWSIKKVLREPWAKRANRGKKGVRLPNIKLRNQMIRSIRKANMVGLLPPWDRRTNAPKRLKRPLTNRIFRFYKLKPRYTCDAVVNRFFAGRKEFWEVLRGRRVLLITQHALKLKEVLQTDPYRMEITGTIVFSHYNQMNNALQQAKAMKDNFDIALISCGVNSVILAPEIARLTGKVAIDFGKGPHVVFKKKNTPRKYSNRLNNRNRNKNYRKNVYSSKYTPGLVSIVISTHNALSSTMECIDSINRYTPEKYQLVLVDNGSEDGTAAYFKSISGATVIVNEVNKGHAEALNQGLLASKGEFIVLLKNDTVVTKDWLPRMIWWLQNDPSIGIVGVRSNLAGRNQKVGKVPYHTLSEMESFAENWSKKHSKQGFKADALSTVCMMFHQNLAAKIGIFDKRFDLKYGEDDFFIRTMIAGKKLWVANDIFIHRVGSSSVSNTEQKKQLDNKRKFDEKWMISQWENYTGIAQREKPFDKRRHYVPLNHKILGLSRGSFSLWNLK